MVVGPGADGKEQADADIERPQEAHHAHVLLPYVAGIHAHREADEAHGQAGTRHHQREHERRQEGRYPHIAIRLSALRGILPKHAHPAQHNQKQGHAFHHPIYDGGAKMYIGTIVGRERTQVHAKQIERFHSYHNRHCFLIHS